VSDTAKTRNCHTKSRSQVRKVKQRHKKQAMVLELEKRVTRAATTIAKEKTEKEEEKTNE